MMMLPLMPRCRQLRFHADAVTLYDYADAFAAAPLRHYCRRYYTLLLRHGCLLIMSCRYFARRDAGVYFRQM